MASWSESEWQARRARGLPAWEAGNAKGSDDYWKRTRENEFFTANPDQQKLATKILQTNAMFDPRSLIPDSFSPFGAGYKNPDTTGPAYPGAPPPPSAPAPAPTNAMLPPATPPSPWQTQPKPPSSPMPGSQPTPGGVGGDPLNPDLWAGQAGGAGRTPSAGGFTESAGGATGAFQPPAGFDNDPAINHQIYGDNYLLNAEQFNALSPEQQGAYRQALAYQFQQGQSGTSTPPLAGGAGQKPNSPDGSGDPRFAGKFGEGPGYVAPTPTPWATPPPPIGPPSSSGVGALPGQQPSQNPTPVAPSTTPAGAPTGGPLTTPGSGNAMMPGNYGGGRGNYMGYGPNGGGLRVDPNYLPENWNYEDSPEFQWQLAQDLRGANRRLLAMGRSDSTGGINAMNNVESSLRAAEVDKAYGRAVGANTTNYGRYIGANTTNYGRTVGEDETGWNRATQLDNTRFGRENLMGEQDWSRNLQLANLGYDATRTGVQSGNQTGANLANLLSANGANQASLALEQGQISSEQIQSLLNAGWTYLQINNLFKQGSSPIPPASGLNDPAYDPNFGAGGGYNPSLPAYNFFA